MRVRVYCLVLGSRGGLGSNRMSGLLNTRCFFRKAGRRAGRQSAGPRSLGQGGCENYTSQHAALLAQGRGWGGLRSSSGKPFSCSCSSCAQLRATGRASSRRRWRRTESSQGCGRRCPPQRLPSGLPCVAWSRARRTSALCTLSTQRALACLPVRVYTLRGMRLLTSSHSPPLRRDLQAPSTLGRKDSQPKVQTLLPSPPLPTPMVERALHWKWKLGTPCTPGPSLPAPGRALDTLLRTPLFHGPDRRRLSWPL